MPLKTSDRRELNLIPLTIHGNYLSIIVIPSLTSPEHYISMDNLTGDKRDLEYSINRVKSTVLSHLYDTNYRFCHPKDEGLVLNKIAAAAKHFISTSVFLIGSIGCGKRRLINKVLAKYDAIGRTLGLDGKLVATVNGATCLNDSQALLSISNQFMYRDPIDKNPNSVLEDLELVLRVRRTCSVLCHFNFINEFPCIVWF